MVSIISTDFLWHISKKSDHWKTNCIQGILDVRDCKTLQAIRWTKTPSPFSFKIDHWEKLHVSNVKSTQVKLKIYKLKLAQWFQFSTLFHVLNARKSHPFQKNPCHTNTTNRIITCTFGLRLEVELALAKHLKFGFLAFLASGRCVVFFWLAHQSQPTKEWCLTLECSSLNRSRRWKWWFYHGCHLYVIVHARGVLKQQHWLRSEWRAFQQQVIYKTLKWSLRCWCSFRIFVTVSWLPDYK